MQRIRDELRRARDPALALITAFVLGAILIVLTDFDHLRLIGTDPDRVVHEVRELLTNRDAYEAMQVDVNPYGDGRAAERIVDLAVGRFSPTASRVNVLNYD